MMFVQGCKVFSLHCLQDCRNGISGCGSYTPRGTVAKEELIYRTKSLNHQQMIPLQCQSNVDSQYGHIQPMSVFAEAHSS